MVDLHIVSWLGPDTKPVFYGAWFWTLVWWVGSAVASAFLSKYLAGKQEGPTEEPWQVPEVAAGTPIPFLVGSQKLTPIVTWFGGMRKSAVKENGAVIGEDHYITAQAVLCWGPASIGNIVFENDQLYTYFGTQKVYNGFAYVNRQPLEVTTNPNAFYQGIGDYTINLNEIYGHKDGVSGDFDFFTGYSDQPPSVLIEDFQPGHGEAPIGIGNVPAYKGLCYIVYDDMKFGLSPTPRNIDFIMRAELSGGNPAGYVRYDPAVGNSIAYMMDDSPEAAAAGRTSWFVWDVTVAAAIWEVLVNRRAGLGFDYFEIDNANFNNIFVATSNAYAHPAADGGPLGVSFALTGGRTTALETINQCLHVLDAILIRDTDSNKLKIKLIRNQAATEGAFNALPVFNQDQITKLKAERREWAETFNEVTITFSNAKLLYNKDTVIVRNNANIAATGSVRTLDIQLPVITNPDVANRVAERELRAQSVPLWKGQMETTRAAFGLEQGDVFRLTYPDYGLEDLICRVLNVNIGSGVEAKIVVDWVEDYYSSEATASVVNQLPDPWTTSGVVAIRNVVLTKESGLGNVDFDLLDPNNYVETMDWRYHSGSDPWSAWTNIITRTDPSDDFTGPYSLQVILSSIEDSQIEVRVVYTTDSISFPSIGEVWTFSSQPRSMVSLIYDMDEGVPTVIAVVPPEVASVKFASSYTTVPTDAEVRASTTIDYSAPFENVFPEIPLGSKLYVAAFGYTSGGLESYKAVVTIFNGPSGSAVQSEFVRDTTLGATAVINTDPSLMRDTVLGATIAVSLDDSLMRDTVLGATLVIDAPEILMRDTVLGATIAIGMGETPMNDTILGATVAVEVGETPMRDTILGATVVIDV